MPFDLQPTLSGELVRVRPLRPEDWEALYGVASDPGIWELHPARDHFRVPVFREFFAEALASGGAVLVSDAVTGEVIGSSRYFGYREQDGGEVEIGWTFLARSRWGGRHNGELKRLMLHHAFRFVASVVFFVAPQNLRSQGAMAKIGGVREPELSDGRVVFRIRVADFHARAGGGSPPSQASPNGGRQRR